LKCINLKEVSKKNNIERLLAEVEIMSMFEHSRYIINMFDYFEDEAYVYLLLEYVDGGSLMHFLDKGSKLREKRASAIFRDLLLGLQELESRGVIHRDLKPSNILMANDGSCKLSDFGLSIKLKSGQHSIKDGVIVGTLDYMSPEILNKEGYNASTDIWSLGAVFFECICGLPPFTAFENNSVSMEKTKENIRKGKINFASATNNGIIISDEAKDLISSMLSIKHRPTIHQIMSHAFFKKYNISFDSPPKTPKTTQLIDMNESFNSAACPINQEIDKKIANERRVKDSLHFNHVDSENSVLVIDGNSLKKISSGNRPHAASMHLNTYAQDPSMDILAGLDSTTKKYDTFQLPRQTPSNIGKVVTLFKHHGTITDERQGWSVAQEMDDEFREWMQRQADYKYKYNTLHHLQKENEMKNSELNDLEFEMRAKSQALDQLKSELKESQENSVQLSTKLQTNRDRATGILSQQEDEIAALQAQIAALASKA
jgi:serine/threonine protein kinase